MIENKTKQNKNKQTNKQKQTTNNIKNKTRNKTKQKQKQSKMQHFGVRVAVGIESNVDFPFPRCTLILYVGLIVKV